MSARATILLVDDEKEIIRLMEIYFANEGYSLLTAADGLEALELLERHSVDLIIMDIMMPRMDGVEACMRIREKRELPIILLSAKSQDIDKITGLSIGADDYVTKPFNPLELLARAKSQLRRYKQFGKAAEPADRTRIEIGELIVDTATHKVTVEGEEVKLTPREFAILRMLAVNRGIVLGMEKIYQEVWNEPFMESKNTVMVHIRKLREKVERDPQAPRYIKTVWGIGYKIDPD